jgi:hypothetical protein
VTGRHVFGVLMADSICDSQSYSDFRYPVRSVTIPESSKHSRDERLLGKARRKLLVPEEFIGDR